MIRSQQIPDSPDFVHWPRHKIQFLETMACQQFKKDDSDVKSYVVVTEDVYSMNKDYTCKICHERLSMKYDVDEEEWVYTGCKIHAGLSFHFPYCYQHVISTRHLTNKCLT